MPDHIHILIGMRPTQSLADLMQQVKQSSSKWINENHLSVSKFAWQAGYGAFSYSKSQIPRVITYIQNQEQHHKGKDLKQEYLELLNEFNIDYDERYIFKPMA
ncbi:MAG: transposase [Psychroserpens sp.]